MPRKSNSPDKSRDRIIDAALTLAAESGWRGLSLREIAVAAKCDLAELRRHFSSKPAILNGFVKRVDDAVLAGSGEADDEDTKRDRLFDVVMRRFDALGPHKEALVNIFQDVRRSPLSAACNGPQLLCSMAWMLEAAGINAGGLRGAVKVQGLALLYGRAWTVWLEDETDDLAPTMAAVDGMLDRVERIMSWRCRREQENEPVAA